MIPESRSRNEDLEYRLAFNDLNITGEVVLHLPFHGLVTMSTNSSKMDHFPLDNLVNVVCVRDKKLKTFLAENSSRHVRNKREGKTATTIGTTTVSEKFTTTGTVPQRNSF